MKKIGLLLLAALLMLLCGCGNYNEYLSVQPHSSAQVSSSGIVVENYDQLRSELIQQVQERAQSVAITTYSYTGDVEQDLTRALDYLQNSYPLGVYAIDSLESQVNRVASYFQITVTIYYSRSASEMNAIEQIRMSEIEQAVTRGLDTFATRQVLHVSGWQETDFTELCANYAAENPRTVEIPTVETEIYPDSGSVRIVVLNYTYTNSQQDLKAMRQEIDQVLAAANSYARYGPSQTEKVQLLYSFLSDRFTYTVGQTSTPAYSMLCQGVADSVIYARIFGLLCQNMEIDCRVVAGLYFDQPHCWLAVTVDGQEVYLDPFSAELAGLAQMPLLLPEQMEDYSWEELA